MNTSSKRLVSLLLCLVTVLSLLPIMAFAATPATLYVKPNDNWNIDGARFAAYFFGTGGQTWVDATDDDGDGIYAVAVPDGFENVIFCRMNPGAAENDWVNKWNQTSDLPIPADGTNCYVVEDGSWDNGVGQWTTYKAGGDVTTASTEPRPEAYYVAGVEALCGVAWDCAGADNQMTKVSDGVYSITYKNVAAGNYEFKVTDGTWNNSWGADTENGNYWLTVETAGDITITFNKEDYSITVSSGATPEPKPEEPAPTELKITKQPVSVKVGSGKTAKVTVTAQGDGLTYKWYYASKGSSKFTYTDSYKTNTYSVPMNASRSGRQVYCVVSDKYGNEVKSDTVTLTMAVLKITKQPTNAVAKSKATAKVTLTAEGEGLTYKWYFANKGATKFTYTSSFKTNTYSLSMTSARSGRQVYCVVSDKYGNEVKSNTVTLYMGNPLKITKQPASVKVASGQTAKVTFTASGDGLTYKWYFAKKGATKFSATSTFKSNTYSMSMTTDRAGRQVYCVVTDKYGMSVKTNTVSLNMGTTLKITKQPASVKVAAGTSAKVTVKVQGDGLTYKWYYANKGSDKFVYTSSFKGATYTLPMTAAKSGRRVYCVITDAYGKSVTTKTVTLTAGTALKITTQPTSVTVASGAKARVTVAAQGDGLTYKWYYAEPGSSKFKLTTSFESNFYSIAMSAARSGRRVYCVITDQYGNTVKTETVTLKMK